MLLYIHGIADIYSKLYNFYKIHYNICFQESRENQLEHWNPSISVSILLELSLVKDASFRIDLSEFSCSQNPYLVLGWLSCTVDSKKFWILLSKLWCMSWTSCFNFSISSVCSSVIIFFTLLIPILSVIHVLLLKSEFLFNAALWERQRWRKSALIQGLGTSQLGSGWWSWQGSNSLQQLHE